MKPHCIVKSEFRIDRSTVVDVIKLFLEIQISPSTETTEQAILDKETVLKITLFKQICAGSDIWTSFIQFLNFGEIQISSEKSFITSTTGSKLGLFRRSIFFNRSDLTQFATDQIWIKMVIVHLFLVNNRQIITIITQE